jgi:hypothetical protein
MKVIVAVAFGAAGAQSGNGTPETMVAACAVAVASAFGADEFGVAASSEDGAITSPRALEGEGEGVDEHAAALMTTPMHNARTDRRTGCLPHSASTPRTIGSRAGVCARAGRA